MPTLRTLALGTSIMLASTAGAATTMKLEVSRALAEDWHSTIDALPGDSIDIRVVVSYTGGPTPVGFSSVIFQPTVSNWRLGTGGDVLSPFLAYGSQTSNPAGAVPNAAGQYGRVSPYAATNITSTNRLFGHVHAASPTTGGISYLRIAQRQVTNWFGGFGNTTGGSGVNMKQWNLLSGARDGTPPQPVFSSQLENVVLFKFNIILSADTAFRTLTVNAPLEGIYGASAPFAGIPYVGWYVNAEEEAPSILDLPTIQQGAINVVPAPSTLALAAAGMLSTRRRRRR